MAAAETASATASQSALTTAADSIGTANVAEVSAVTDAREAYETASVNNDKTYLDAMAPAEKTYLREHKRGHSTLHRLWLRLIFVGAKNIPSITRWFCLPCPEPGQWPQ